MRTSQAVAKAFVLSVLFALRPCLAAERQCDRSLESCELDEVLQSQGSPPRGDQGSGRELGQEIDPAKMGLLFFFAALVILWIFLSIKWAVDGSLPARLAVWGLLPEAFAAISVPAVAALLRLKSGTTPVVMLKASVSDSNADQLAKALQKHGKSAELQALELPFNREMGAAGLEKIVGGLLRAESPLEELELSYNPQLGAAALTATKPLWTSLTVLRLVDCGLQKDSLEALASASSKLKLNTLDLSSNFFTDAGETLAEVMEAPVLEDLGLANCSLSLDDLRHVAEELRYTSLRSLQLAGNHLKGDGLQVLAEHLPGCHLDSLDVERNELKVEDLSCLGQAWAKRPFSRLRLQGNDISDEELKSFIKTLRTMSG